MTVIRQEDFIASVAGALQYISYYHPVDYITFARPGLRARAVAGGARRHGADPHQQPHVRRGSPAHLPGHGHRECLRQAGHGRALRTRPRRRTERPAADGGRRRAPRLSRSRQQAARQPSGRPRGQAHQHQRQHAGRCLCRTGARRDGRGHCRGQGRRLGGEVEVRHAQPHRFGRRLGAEDGAHHGRGLVPAGHSRHRHRRHLGESDAAGQAIADGPHRHSGPHGPRREDHRRKTAPRDSTTR